MIVRKDRSEFMKTIGNLVSKAFTLSFTAALSVILTAAPAMASELSYSPVEENDNYLLYENDNSGYQILIDDEADLFSPEEEADLISRSRTTCFNMRRKFYRIAEKLITAGTV